MFASGGKKEIKSKLNIRKSGSAALDLAYVASGDLMDIFKIILNIWDIAAGLILVTEAGGKTNFININLNTNNYKVLMLLAMLYMKKCLKN